MNPRSLGVLVLCSPVAWPYISSLGLQCAPGVPGSYGLNNGPVQFRRRLVQLESIDDVREGSAASEGGGFMGSRRTRKTGKGGVSKLWWLFFLGLVGWVVTLPSSAHE